MNSEIIRINRHFEAQVRKISFLLENKKRNLEAEVEEIMRELESETKKQKRDSFFFSPPSEDLFTFDSSFSQSEDSEEFIDIGEF